MKNTRHFIIGLNLVGLTLVTAAEAIRPGVVSGTVNVGIIWLAVFISLLWKKAE